MLESLQKKLISMNMLSIGTVIAISFLLIFLMNYFRVEINLRSLVDNVNYTKLIEDESDSTDLEGYDGSDLGTSIDYMKYFVAKVDFGDMSSSIYPKIVMEHQEYNEIIKEALAQDKKYGKVTAGNRIWMYKSVSPVLIFVDGTTPINSVFQIAVVLVCIGVFALSIVYVLSVRWANRAVSPIAISLEKQKQFIADASHELKTPLAVITSNLDVVLSNRESTIADQAKWLGYIREESIHMNTIIGELLTLAKAESKNKMVSNDKPFMPDIIDIRLAVIACALRMETRFYEKGIYVEIDGTQLRLFDNDDADDDFYDDDEPRETTEPAGVVNVVYEDFKLRIDEEKFNQIVMILLDNALKYTPNQGKVIIEVSKIKHEKKLYLARGEDDLVVKIKNSVAEDVKNLENVFDRFYRAKPSSGKQTDIPGFGLGLAIAKTFLDEVGGEIGASMEGDLASFVVVLKAD